MLVATTGIHGTYLKQIRSALEKHGLRYEAEFSSATSVLVARRLDGLKYEAAQKRGIPCVTPAWVLMGECSVKRMAEFEAGKSLLGMEVCGTSLSDVERRGVRDVCKAIQAVYNPTLTHCCILLVLPRTLASIDESNEKMLFARKNHIAVLQYDQFAEQYGFGAALHHADQLPAVTRSSSGIIAYCTPPEDVTNSVRGLLGAAGAILQSSLTMNTTHVIVLAPTTELFIPSAELEFVSIAWLEQCAALKTRVAADPYRVKVPQGPIIAFTSLSQSEREGLRRAIESTKSLPCIVQDEFVLGSENGGNRYNTTHLIVKNSEAAVGSQKVTALCLRAHKLRTQECLIVESDWVRYSLQEGRWIDCTRFVVALPEVSSLKGMIPQKTSMLKANSISKEKRENEERPNPQVKPHEVVEEEEDNEEKRQQKEEEAAAYDRSAPNEMNYPPADGVRSNSLESIIEALECEESVSMPLPPPKPHPEKLRNAKDGDNENDYPTVSITSFNYLLRKQSMESQIVFYAREGTVESNYPNFIPRNDGRDSAVTAASHVTIVDKDKCSIQPPRVCLMIAKALVDKQECLPRLQSIGCTLATTIEECTHYVTAKPSRTEFFLSSVAAGKWVLAPSFIEEMLREGRIVREESHEWSPVLARAAQQRHNVIELVQACALQRRRADRPFASWRVALCCTDANRAESFSRVLRSGGCEVTKSSTPPVLLSTVAVDAGALRCFTHIFSDDDVWDKKQLESMISRTHCIPPVLRLEFIAHSLCVEVPEPERYKVVSNPRSHKRPRDVPSG